MWGAHSVHGESPGFSPCKPQVGLVKMVASDLGVWLSVEAILIETEQGKFPDSFKPPKMGNKHLFLFVFPF